MQLFVRLSEDLTPLVFEIPIELVAHLDLLKQLGAGETATVSRLIELLQVSVCRIPKGHKLWITLSGLRCKVADASWI